ncbi:MAG: PilZ domain-containing protein [Candidatus Omnitrophota bacterium]
MEQKRVYRRIEGFVKVECISHACGVTTVMTTQTRDIGAGGVKVYLNYSFKPKNKIQLKITLPVEYNQPVINTESEVITSNLIGVIGDTGEEKLYETRFKFTKIDLNAKQAITHYVYDWRKKKRKAKFDLA